ncbi:ArnT family glycosyltransferase [Poritiphilus flavus]|uniref:Glycosyltransferase n=1 Tax=Poritiphilus flavus TaxID=2697053 RepID=A0A6L9ED30_9FLAO|nr:glycosyltransferase family 39 protein [Poritiphilus flavus]NAS12607.1 glycosyltransferase [Poritiphilus flavus]
MIDKIITALTPDYHKLTAKRVFLILFCIAFFIRFPFFFRDYIDLDESTFILMGQSWLDGHFPYTELWDLKPPLVFLFFAGIIGLFGKSFVALRLAGVAVVVLGALYLYKIGKRVHSPKLGFWSSVLFVVLSSLFGSLQGVMSEHISMAFFLAGYYQLTRSSSTNIARLLLAAVLLGGAFMTKLNLSYAILLLVLVYCYQAYLRQGVLKTLSVMSLLGIGIILPAAILFTMYYFHGYGAIWWESVISASIAYGRIPFSERTDTLVPIAIIVVLIGLFVRWNIKKKAIPDQWHLLFLLAACSGILFSFYKVGKVNGHYLIQLYPFLILLLLSFVFYFSFFSTEKVGKTLLFLALLTPTESYLEYYAIANNYLKKNTLYNGEGIEVPKYLSAQFPDVQNIWFMEFHIGYWYLGQNPPTKATTHPSNLMRDQLFPYMRNPRGSSLEELQFILNSKAPEIIVTKGERIPFNAENKEEVYAYFEKYLKVHYQFVEQIGKATIYKRL